MTSSRIFSIKVPASTANLGPGFDALGAALSVYLVVKVVIDGIEIRINSEDPNIPQNPLENLITKCAFFVANCHGKLLPGMIVNIDNPIPLGRGMGSSGSAVVAGVSLANEVFDNFDT